jgi:hypothetical protein
MKTFGIILFILLNPLITNASEGVYISTTLLYTYGSGEHDSKSALLGTGVSITGGLKVQAASFEFGIKQVSLSNESIGNDSYDTIIKDSIFFGGGRLFLSKIFSLKAGLASHYLSMDISKNNSNRNDLEDGGNFLGTYAGMGIFHPINNSLDFYYESTLYPIPDTGLFLIDMEIGIRLHL